MQRIGTGLLQGGPFLVQPTPARTTDPGSVRRKVATLQVASELEGNLPVVFLPSQVRSPFRVNIIRKVDRATVPDTVPVCWGVRYSLYKLLILKIFFDVIGTFWASLRFHPIASNAGRNFQNRRPR